MESILKQAGSCGCYQVIHLISAQLPRFLAAWTYIFMMFGAYDPGWRCARDNPPDVYSSNNSIVNLTQNNSLSSFAFFDESDLDLMHENVSRDDNIMEMGLYNETCDVFEYCENGIKFNPSSSTITTEFELVCDRSWYLRAILLVQGLGVLLVPLAAGQIGDKFGRKFSLYGCTAVICVSSGVAIFSHHWLMFAICYFFIGGAANSTMGISPVFSLEVLNSKWRGYYSSIPTSNIAMFLFAIVSYLIQDWVLLHAIACVMAFASCIGFLIVPESPRWLVINGQVLKAEEAIQKIAKFNKRDRIDKASFRKFREAVRKEATSERNYTLLDLFRNKQLAPMAIRFCLLFLVLSITYMSTSYGIASLPGDYYTNAMMANGIEIVFVTVSGPLCNGIGRRFAGLVFGVIALVSCVAITIAMLVLDDSSSSSSLATRTWIVNIFAFFAKCSSQAMFGVGTTINAELFPTVVRSAMLGLLRSCVGIGGLIMPFLMPSKGDSSLTVYFGILAGCYLVPCVVFPSFPETNKRNLADSLVRTGPGVGEQLEIFVPVVAEKEDNDDGNDNDDGVGDGRIVDKQDTNGGYGANGDATVLVNNEDVHKDECVSDGDDDDDDGDDDADDYNIPFADDQHK